MASYGWNGINNNISVYEGMKIILIKQKYIFDTVCS